MYLERHLNCDVDDPWAKYQLPNDLSYEGWVDYVFDHPVLEPQWWWQDPESGYWRGWDDSANPARTLAYLTRLFQSPAFLLHRFTRGQIDQGLNLLVSISCSEHMCVLADATLPWKDRRACFNAMIPLYTQLLAPVYQNDLGHTQRGTGDAERETFSCYMWWDVLLLRWDVIPLSGDMAHQDLDRINDAVLNVFEQILQLKAESCLESVLHGLGHWHKYIPDRTEPIVRSFLSRTDISPELRRYAEKAAVGAVQ